MKKMGLFTLLVVGYTAVSLALLLYSYTQVDLSLTLTRVSVWQTIQRAFQYIGYYQRPLSTAIYCVILLGLYVLYYWTIRCTQKRTITENQLWRVLFTVVIVLVLSYPAFSYDMFNYIFTAKTVLVYHKNPYEVIPFQFVGVDPLLSFMHWTHLPSAYTPLWIALTLPAYLLGFGYFLLTLWNLKVLVACFYLATVWGIGRILEHVEPENKVTGMAIFALNPLVLIECLVSAHNDVVMMAFAMLAWLLYLQKKRICSLFVLSLSVATKLMTLFVVPVALLGWNRMLAFIAIMVGFVLVLFQREVLPWYLVWIIPFVALLPKRTDITLLAGAGSLGLLLRYAPYLYLGHWNDPVPAIKLWVTLVPLALALLFIFLTRTVLKGKTIN